MAGQRSVEMLAFVFASIKFACKRLAQGLSRSVSVFSSFMHEYCDPVVRADQCGQYWNCSQQCHGPYQEHSGSLPKG